MSKEESQVSECVTQTVTMLAESGLLRTIDMEVVEEIKDTLESKFTQAAANKAAEEGGLTDEQIYALYQREFEGAPNVARAAPKSMPPFFYTFVRAAIAADRAARQVANKAEVELDAGFLQWVHDRLRFVHGENENVDYMHKLRAIIASVPSDRNTSNVASIAIPPATTGASTVLTDERIDALWADERRKKPRMLSDSQAFRLIFARAIEREVAAQAGQVAPADDHLTEDQKWLLESADMVRSGGYPNLASKIREACKATVSAGQVAVPEAVRVLREAIQKQLAPDWECNSNHPALFAALKATGRLAAPAKESK